jgi:hypothetical protein
MSQTVKRINFEESDVIEYLYRENLFKENEPTFKMDYDSFKKAFFP